MSKSFKGINWFKRFSWIVSIFLIILVIATTVILLLSGVSNDNEVTQNPPKSTTTSTTVSTTNITTTTTATTTISTTTSDTGSNLMIFRNLFTNCFVPDTENVLVFLDEHLILKIPSFNESGCDVTLPGKLKVDGVAGIVTDSDSKPRLMVCFSDGCWFRGASKWTKNDMQTSR